MSWPMPLKIGSFGPDAGQILLVAPRVAALARVPPAADADISNPRRRARPTDSVRRLAAGDRTSRDRGAVTIGSGARCFGKSLVSAAR